MPLSLLVVNLIYVTLKLKILKLVFFLLETGKESFTSKHCSSRLSFKQRQHVGSNKLGPHPRDPP